MSTELVNLATFVESRLASGWSPSQPLTVRRTWRPRTTRHDAAGVLVSVTPRTSEITPLTRDADQGDHEIGVLIQRRLDDPETAAAEAQIDALDALVEEVIDRLDRQSPSEAYRFLGLRRDPVIDDDDLEAQLFTTLITITYQAKTIAGTLQQGG